jgi:hypothetical protein
MDESIGTAVAAAGGVIPTGATSGNNVGNQFISNYNFDTINIREQIDIFAIPDYIFLEDTYTGQGGYKSGKYLVPHPRETAYNRRRQLSVYRGYFKKIVDAKVMPIFNQAFVRTTTDANFELFLKDVDNNKTGINPFMKRLATDSVVKGVSFVLMDNFSAADQPESAGEAEDSRILPYVYMKAKADVAAYELDDFGNIDEIIFTDKDAVVGTDKNGRDKTEKRFRLWNDEYSQIMKWNTKTRKYEPAGPEVPHNLGIVPVCPLFTAKRDTDELLPASEMWDLAKLCWSLYGVDSEIRQQVRDQCFSVFYYMGDNNAMLTLGTANALALPQDTKIAPGFAQPNPQTLAGNIAYAQSIYESMLELAEQHGVTGVQKQMSGEAKAWDFQANNEVLKNLSMICKDVEIWIAKTFALYMGAPGSLDIYDPQYLEDFAPRGEMEDLKMLQAGLDDNISPKTNVEIKKRMISIILSNLKDEVLQKLYKDIEETSTAQGAAKADAAARLKESLAGSGDVQDQEAAGNKAADSALMLGGSAKVAAQDTMET